jgi:hypothetical protein
MCIHQKGCVVDRVGKASKDPSNPRIPCIPIFFIIFFFDLLFQVFRVFSGINNRLSPYRLVLNFSPYCPTCPSLSRFIICIVRVSPSWLRVARSELTAVI